MTAHDNDVYRPSDRDLLRRAIRETAARPSSGVFFAGLVNRTELTITEFFGTTTYAGVYRRRLLDAGVIVEAARGLLDFAVPHLREYLREHAASMYQPNLPGRGAHCHFQRCGDAVAPWGLKIRPWLASAPVVGVMVGE